MAKFITIGILVIIVLYVIVTYNALIRLRNWVREAWSQINVQLQRRHDLIPNLINTVKGYRDYERETLEAIVEKRNQLITGTPQERMDADAEIQGALKNIFALSEAYPDLKANENFIQLQEELTTTENKVAYARQLYNQTVAQYNMKREYFPSNLIANLFNFERKEPISVPEEAREVPTVEF